MAWHKHDIRALLESYQEQLKKDTEIFWISDPHSIDFYTDAAVLWCAENLDDDCWCFEPGGSDIIVRYYIKGDENIMAFKLRWS